MTLSRSALACLLVLLPLVAFAQEEDALRAAIRADITSDPRSAEMSPTELDALVDALAARAEEQGEAEGYLNAQNSFDDVPFEAPVYEPPAAEPYDALSLAIGAFFLVLLGVWIMLAIQRKKRHERTPSDGMVV
jgi:hypothetical protein